MANYYLKRKDLVGNNAVINSSDRVGNSNAIKSADRVGNSNAIKSADRVGNSLAINSLGIGYRIGIRIRINENQYQCLSSAWLGRRLKDSASI